MAAKVQLYRALVWSRRRQRPVDLEAVNQRFAAACWRLVWHHLRYRRTVPLKALTAGLPPLQAVPSRVKTVVEPPHDPLWALRYLLGRRRLYFWLCPHCGARHFALRTAPRTMPCCFKWAEQWGKEVRERRPSGAMLIRERGKYLQVVFGEHGRSGWSWRPPQPGVGAVLDPSGTRRDDYTITKQEHEAYLKTLPPRLVRRLKQKAE